RRDVDVDAAFAVGHGEPRLRPEKRLVLRPDVVDAGDGDFTLRVGIAVADHHVPDDVRPGILEVAVATRWRAVVERLRLRRALGVDDRLERLVGDDDLLRGATRLLRM